MNRVAMISLVAIFFAGCAAQPPNEPGHSQELLAPLGLARIQGRTDIVSLPANVEHVLYPKAGVKSEADARPAAIATSQTSMTATQSETKSSATPTRNRSTEARQKRRRMCDLWLRRPSGNAGFSAAE